MRFLLLLALLVSLPAGAVTFDFDDFGVNAPGYTCVPRDCGELKDAGHYYSQATIVKDGLALTIERFIDFEFWQVDFGQGWIIDEGDPSNIAMFHLTFSTPLRELTLDAAGPRTEEVDLPGRTTVEKDMWLRAYLYDSNGGLLEDFLRTEPVIGDYYVRGLTFTHPEGISEIWIGNVPFDEPDCVSDCTGGTSGGGFALDNIIATPVPEPGNGALVALGLVALTSARRIRG